MNAMMNKQVFSLGAICGVGLLSATLVWADVADDLICWPELPCDEWTWSESFDGGIVCLKCDGEEIVPICVDLPQSSCDTNYTNKVNCGGQLASWNCDGTYVPFVDEEFQFACELIGCCDG